MALKSELEENPFAPPIDDDFLRTALEYRDNFENDEEFQEALSVWPRCPDCGRRRVTRCPICKTSGTLFPLGDDNFWDFRSDEEKARDAELFDEEESCVGGCGGCGSSTARRQNRAWADVGRSKSGRRTLRSTPTTPERARVDGSGSRACGSGGERGESCACGSGGERGESCVCGSGGERGEFCVCGSGKKSVDAPPQTLEPENFFEKGFVAICHVCSEAFVPKFPKRCEWCDFEFPDGEEPAESVETPADVLAFLARKKAEEADDFLDQPATPQFYWTLVALGVGALLFCAYFAFLFQ